MEKYKNSKLGVEERVEDLLSLMTLEEKIGQLNQVMAGLDNKDEVRNLIREGKVGSRILAVTAFAGNEAQITAGVTEGNEAQRIAVEESRLGIPVITGRDVIHGHRTVFPIPLAQAASWNPELVEDAAAISGLEASSEGVNWTFAPMLDISRDPRWGRIIESFGEDPFLSSVMAGASIKGYQGKDLSEEGKVAACAKHYIGYGASEGGRDYESIELSDNTLRNIYLPPFKAAIDEGVSTVMSAFHENNGEPVTASSYLLTEVLKEELGFDGFVISDWDSVRQLIHQRVAADEKEAAELALNAGVDMDMCSYCYITHLKALVEEGKVSIEKIDDAVRRILRIKFKLGLFEKPFTDIEMGKKVQFHEEHLRCARKLAAQSMVLLKNDNGILPLLKRGKRIAVVGPMAEEKTALMGSWVLDGSGADVVSVSQGIKGAAPEAEIITASSSLTDEMIAAARKAEIIVVVLGESNIRTGEANSVADIVLPPGQEELVQMLRRFGKPIAAVICAGRPLAITRIAELADAILYAWHPGTLGGLAIADIIFGDTNPSGKLPVTMVRYVGQVPLYYNHKSNGRAIDEYFNDVQFTNYHDMTGTPLYPFGFGLSFTTFRYENLSINKAEISRHEKLQASVLITNTGTCEGEEIVQLYIRDKIASVTRPVKELKGFKRIQLKPNQSEKVYFEIGEEELAFYGKDGKLKVEPGEYTAFIGRSCITELAMDFKIV